MRVSQVMIEPVLRDAILDDPLVEARWGVAFEDFVQDETGVTATLRIVETGATETVRCDFLAGCDGGSSDRARAARHRPATASANVAHRYMVHFRSDARDILQAFGVAWHYQSAMGTLIAQDDKDTWTLQTRCRPASIPAAIDPNAMLDAWVGRGGFAREILVANPWFTHLLLAERYAERPRVPGRRLGAPVHPDRRLRHEHRHRRRGRSRLEARRGASRASPGRACSTSYERERRPVGYRNRLASERHTGVRLKIAELYQNERDPDALARGIAALGNAENESWGIEFGYRYDGVEGDPVVYEPTTAPGARLPSVFLRDGSRALRPARPVVHPAALRRCRSVAADRRRAGAARDGDRRRSLGRADLRGQARAGAPRHPRRLARRPLRRRPRGVAPGAGMTTLHPSSRPSERTMSSENCNLKVSLFATVKASRRASVMSRFD